MKYILMILSFAQLSIYRAQEQIPLSSYTEQFGLDVIICNGHTRNHFSIGDSLSDLDTLNCIVRRTFKTDSADKYYIQEFSLNEKIREEGFGREEWFE